MAVEFPKAVVFDRSAKHHVGVTVDNSNHCFHYVCGECDMEEVLPLDHLSGLRSFIQDLDHVQIMYWIEIND